MNGFGPAANGDLPCYALPAGTRIDVFDDPSQMDEAEAAFQEMRGSTAIGVDAEWVAGRPISLLQLSIRGRCVLLRMHRLAEVMRSRPPPSLEPPAAPYPSKALATPHVPPWDPSALRAREQVPGPGFYEPRTGAVRASFLNSGQICLCASRLLVQKTADGFYERFTSAFARRARELTVAGRGTCGAGVRGVRSDIVRGADGNARHPMARASCSAEPVAG